MNQFASALSIFEPSDSDWVVTVATKDGRVLNRRITPSTMSETEALRLILVSEMIRPETVADAKIQRAGAKASFAAILANDPFLALVQRLKPI